MIKENTDSKVLDMVEEELLSTRKIKDNSDLLKEFYELKCPKPKKYRAVDVCKIRKKLHVTQIVFAYLLNAKVSTVQKWERGVKNPSGANERLLQILEAKGVEALQIK